MAVFAILAAENNHDTTHIIVDYRVGICPFNVNKCDVTDTLLPMVLRRDVFNLRNALNNRSAEHNVEGITPSICDPPQEFDAKGESTLTTRLHDTLSVP